MGVIRSKEDEDHLEINIGERRDVEVGKKEITENG